jgi:type II secretory pathway pseudopilin PulG
MPYSYHRMQTGGQRRASLPETVGAWLRIWTPPRDVQVPDVPVRKLLIGTAIAAVVLGVAAAIIVPRIDARKARLAADDARAQAALIKQRRLQAIAEQRPQTLKVAALKPAAGAPESALLAARVALIGRAETAITADARHRAATGELKGNPAGTSCEPYPPDDPGPERDLSERKGAYDCFVAIGDVPGDKNNLSGHVGYPFRAVLDFQSFSIAWCRMNLVPGEKVIPDPAFVTALPRACRLPPR